MECNHSNAAFTFQFKGYQEKSQEKKGLSAMLPVFSVFALPGVMFIEIAGFILAGSAIGVLPTLLLIMLSMAAGIFLLRRQGISVLRRIERVLAAGHVPDHEMAEGAMIVTGAILLVIPGFVTDMIGIALFIPPLRNLILNTLSQRLSRHRPRGRKPRETARTIDLNDGDYHTVSTRSSPWRKPPDHNRSRK